MTDVIQVEKMSECGDNYNRLNEEIRSLCKDAGRDESECTLIAVSKTKPVDLIKDAYAAVDW